MKIANRRTPQISKDPSSDFSAICADSRLWSLIDEFDIPISLGHGNSEFLIGVATSTYQDSGSVHCPNSQWASWEMKILPLESRSCSSANLYQLYQSSAGLYEITKRLQILGVNSYRFSIEWSQIQPGFNQYDLKSLDPYINLCKHLRDHGIQPMVTLYHFSEPKWFHEMGSFSQKDNIKYFIEFARMIAPYFVQIHQGKPLVELFCTINEPAVDAFSRYVHGTFSPGESRQFYKAGIFLKNALLAHDSLYELLKKLSPTTRVGISHAYLHFESLNLLLCPVARYMNRLLNETVLRVFKTGVFELKIPFACHIVEKGLKFQTDFVGLQYYARPLIGFPWLRLVNTNNSIEKVLPLR